MPCADNALMTTVGVGCEATDERSRDVVRLFARTRMGVVRAGYEYRSPWALGIARIVDRVQPVTRPPRAGPSHEDDTSPASPYRRSIYRNYIKRRIV